MLKVGPQVLLFFSELYLDLFEPTPGLLDAPALIYAYSPHVISLGIFFVARLGLGTCEAFCF